jgi:hypothetical protein
MGAVESSSLENIDSLSSALERIEQVRIHAYLGVFANMPPSTSIPNISQLLPCTTLHNMAYQTLTTIESSHLHHEAKLCHDDMVLICSKKIHCKPSETIAD